MSNEANENGRCLLSTTHPMSIRSGTIQARECAPWYLICCRQRVPDSNMEQLFLKARFSLLPRGLREAHSTLPCCMSRLLSTYFCPLEREADVIDCTLDSTKPDENHNALSFFFPLHYTREKEKQVKKIKNLGRTPPPHSHVLYSRSSSNPLPVVIPPALGRPLGL